MITRALARAIDSVRIHRVWTERVDGRDAIVKRRRLGMGFVIGLGNLFLALSNSRIVMFPSVSDWQKWELHCFELLNGDVYRSGRRDRRTIYTERVPGQSLADLVASGRDTTAAFEATGVELARVHRLHSDGIDGPWSHGDPHLENVLYDESTGRARLIDFETLHEPAPSRARHADDLLVLLLDLLGRSGEAHLVPLARAMLDAYDDNAVRAAVAQRLECPRGLELVLWHTRTNFVGGEALVYRLDVLREALA